MGILGRFALQSNYANALLVIGGGATSVFLAGGYYFSMKERYERQVEALNLQLVHERQGGFEKFCDVWCKIHCVVCWPDTIPHRFSVYSTPLRTPPVCPSTPGFLL